MIMNPRWPILLASMLLAVIIAAGTAVPAVHAAPFELTVTYKTAFDKMTASADKTTAAKLKQQYADLLASQKQEVSWDTFISGLHSRNTTAETAVREKIKQVDAAKLEKLKSEADKTREKYADLFELYDKMYSQLRLAKSIDSKTAVALLKPQVDSLKIAVAIARDDIRGKDAAYKAAKTAAAKKIAAYKKTLEGIESYESKIKTAKATNSSTKKLFDAEARIVKDALKKGDSKRTLGSLSKLLAYSKQINEQKAKIYSFEGQITAIITATGKQIA
ncbi:hypothetical protein [Paenibacillus harenae]|uniref:Uncharacterized protein n=1 Tax=Paenibacillus harenae TaxID=306543 RepID=A0ABT9U2T3_PAEHA|nr:hypothetical protein [Paenibacillus harenae]MDQ0113941.1 hypothetical protein [Paenibacillus harenae]